MPSMSLEELRQTHPRYYAGLDADGNRIQGQAPCIDGHPEAVFDLVQYKFRLLRIAPGAKDLQLDKQCQGRVSVHGSLEILSRETIDDDQATRLADGWEIIVGVLSALDTEVMFRRLTLQVSGRGHAPR